MECNPCQGEGCNMEECKGDSCCFGDSEPLPFYQTPLAAVTRRRTAATPTPTSAMPSVAAFGDCSLLAHHSLLLSPHCSLSLGGGRRKSLRPAQALQGCQEFGQKTKLT
mmetsp:Transcript_33474/g.78995  ORF Transcript_33474/g.78995 Transcript_33474/m.78995 type:complete len:109 (-) Transcript_33474:548-874(-)